MRTSVRQQSGVTLIELIVFIVVSAIIVTSLASVFRHAMISLEQPIINSQMLDMARSQLNSILSRRFDENSPSNGVPCDINVACVGIGLDSGENINSVDGLDDVDDFHGYSDIPRAGFIRTVSVVSSGSSLGIQQAYAKRINVTVTSSNGDVIVVTAYKVNQ